jgi:riboflavin kinase/FMN adenylyltransferase
VRFESHQIKGRGRATTLGFPTINLEVPVKLDLQYGIYGVYLFIGLDKYLGAMHFGSSPTFNDEFKSCEIYLIDLKDKSIPNTSNQKLSVEVLKYIREVKKFDDIDQLVKQIDQDIEEIKKLSRKSA